MNKKYELTNEKIEFGEKTLYRIIALKDFGLVRKGDLGGFVESEKNLSQDDICWIWNDAKVMDNALVKDKAHILNSSIVKDNVIVSDSATINEHVVLKNNVVVKNSAEVIGKALITDNAIIQDDVQISDNVHIRGSIVVKNNTVISGSIELNGDAVISSMHDYMVFKNNWSSGRYFVWTRSNNMWTVGCFYGTGEELIKEAYRNSETSGQMYEKFVKFVEENFVKKS